MSRPIKNRGKWRIRWPEASGNRRSEVYDDYKGAQIALSRHRAEAEEVRRGLRAPDPSNKTFDELCDLWEEERVPQKRSGGNDRRVIRQLKEHFAGKMLRDVRGRGEVCSRRRSRHSHGAREAGARPRLRRATSGLSSL